MAWRLFFDKISAMQILVIEDDVKTAEFIAGAFGQAGYRTTICPDGETGFAAAAHGSFDAAVIDIMLPKKDGLSIIREIRNMGRTLPVIVLSARGNVDAKVLGLEAGADDYLGKPFSIAELIARMQALLRRSSMQDAAAATVLKVGDLEMDLVSPLVTRGGERIDLQPLEYQLLEYLMRNKGRVVSRNTILERVWNYDFDPHTNVVEVRVCRLRDKIDRGSSRSLIATVRGFGYVLG